MWFVSKSGFEDATATSRWLYSSADFVTLWGTHENDILTPPTGEELSEYLKTAEAAEFLGVSQNTLRTWAKQGKIEVRVNPVNNYRLFRRKDLQKFLDSVAKPVSRKAK